MFRFTSCREISNCLERISSAYPSSNVASKSFALLMNTVTNSVLGFAANTPFALKADIKEIAKTKISSDVLSSYLDRALGIPPASLTLGIVGVGYLLFRSQLLTRKIFGSDKWFLI